MKKVLLPLVILFFTVSLFAQKAENPFEKLGFKASLATSSKGEFDEFHDLSQKIEIGSVIYDTKNKAVIGFVDKEKTENEVSVITTAMSIDPHCERYYWISPYAFCLNNPVRYIDPDGRDVWEINDNGEIINRIKDTTQDAFYMVAKDANGDYQRTYSTDADGNKVYNSKTFEYGTVISQKTQANQNGTSYDVYQIRGDGNATSLFEFMGEHITKSSTAVEVSQAKTGIEGDKGLNFITTSHEKARESGMSHLLSTQLLNGYTIREINHTHPHSETPSGSADAGKLSGDLGFAKQVTDALKSRGYTIPSFNIFFVKNNTYHQFGK